MKKIFLILVSSLFIFIGCNKDSKETNPIDPIIGTWQVWSDSGEELDSCIKKTTFNFYKNGKLKIINFKGNEDKCSFDGESIEPWKNLGNGYYELNLEEKKNKFFILFSDNNKTFKLSGSKNQIIKDGDYEEFRKK